MGSPLPGYDDHGTRSQHADRFLGGGGGSRRQFFGTRYHRYRCFLPDLAGFAANRREDTDASHHRLRLAEG